MAFSEVDTTDRFVEINADGPTKNITKSTGTASGDFAIIVVSWYEVNNYTVTTPTGFTAQGELVIGGSGTTESRLAVFTRACDGTEAANYPITFSNAGVFANAVLITLRSDRGAITFGSATQGTPASGTTCTAPSVSGTSGQALVCPFGYGDPTTVSTPGGMTVGPTGGTSTNGATWFWETLVATGATGTRVSTLGTSRDNGAWSILLTEPSGISPIPLGNASKPKKSSARRNWDSSGWFNTRGHAKGWFYRLWVPATSGVTGTLNYTNANDTLAATGTTTVTGTLATTNANDTLTASGTTTVTGALATTNANDTLAAVGTTTVTGTLAYTNNDDTLSASGSVGGVDGSLTYTNENDTLSATGTTTVTGTLAYTNNNDTLAANGVVGGVDGTLAYTNNDDTLVAIGIVTSEALVGKPRRRKKPLYNVYFNELPIGVESAKELIELARISDSIPRVTLSKREDYGSKITALKKAIKQIEAERNMQIEQQEEEEATLFLMLN